GNDCQSNKDDCWKSNIVPECPNIVSGLEHLKELEFLEFCGDLWEILQILSQKKRNLNLRVLLKMIGVCISHGFTWKLNFIREAC
ncbi:hypothetical protein MKX01_033835, partial [Papaver californicum]